jgi:hypothetical protein
MVQMVRGRTRTFSVLATLAIVAAGCGSGAENADNTISPVAPVSTLGGVGEVPAVPAAVREPVVVVRPPVNVDGTEAQLIGEIAGGNRILMIGDSILASTSSRYGNHMCNAVVPLGWQVAVEAEPSRFIDFGNRVLDRALSEDPDPEDDWNAAVVFLGSNYGGDAIKYEIHLARILDRLAPRPTLLFTVTEYRPNYVEVNEVVNRLGAERDNVTVLDWKTISETPGILSSDRLHPTDAGRRVLAESVAAALGPVDGEGDCLRSTFRDDSAVGSNSTKVLGPPSTGSGSTGTTTTTTKPPTSVTTTTAPSGGGGGGGGATGTTTTSPQATTTTLRPSSSTTVPPTTAAPTTTPPPSTAPPTTAPPTTAPPTTAPPGLIEPTP